MSKSITNAQIIAAVEKKFEQEIFAAQIQKFKIDADGNLIPFFQDGLFATDLSVKLYCKMQLYVNGYLSQSNGEWLHEEPKKQNHLGFIISYKTRMIGVEEIETVIYFDGIERGSMPCDEYLNYAAKIAALEEIVF